MNVDRILQTLNDHAVSYLLIGGMNFLLRHAPVLTYDVDVWIEDSAANRGHCETALRALGAQWGETDANWRPVSEQPAGWLQRQSVFCLTSAHGPIDVFRAVRGLSSWQECRDRAIGETTVQGTPYLGLADVDMLRCQLALAEELRKKDRIAALERAIGGQHHDG